MRSACCQTKVLIHLEIAQDQLILISNLLDDQHIQVSIKPRVFALPEAQAHLSPPAFGRLIQQDKPRRGGVPGQCCPQDRGKHEVISFARVVGRINGEQPCLGIVARLQIRPQLLQSSKERFFVAREHRRRDLLFVISISQFLDAFHHFVIGVR